MFARFKEFAVRNNVSHNWVAHPKSNIQAKYGNDEAGNRIMMPCMPEHLNGGAAWDNSMDGIYSMNRPLLPQDPTSTLTNFINFKQRKQELVGERGAVGDIIFEPITRRYIFEGQDPIKLLV